MFAAKQNDVTPAQRPHVRRTLRLPLVYAVGAFGCMAMFSRRDGEQ